MDNVLANAEEELKSLSEDAYKDATMTNRDRIRVHVLAEITRRVVIQTQFALASMNKRLSALEGKE